LKKAKPQYVPLLARQNYITFCSLGNTTVSATGPTGQKDQRLSADGHLMPARKDQPPPDLRYFKQTGK
jgi:hypothetical protein